MKAIAVMVLAACLGAGARAQTFAEVALTHVQQTLVTPGGSVVVRDEDLSFVVSVHGDGEGAGAFGLDISLSSPDQQMEVVFDYTITLSSRGLPYPGPRSEYCTPVQFFSQCVEPFGAEGTFAQILLNRRDPRNANPFIEASIDEVSLTFAGTGNVGRLLQSGQLSSTVFTTVEEGASDRFGVNAFVNAFASPVPEASTWVSMLAGIALLAAASARRRPAGVAARRVSRYRAAVMNWPKALKAQFGISALCTDSRSKP